ncbi:SRPBCC family protein [uncultured Roseobacter sp.]|uniref:SRPBCC family protein n=1 Tax=uncultured Roseobacter sp. TaxID=114847 RepID=UPI0026054F5C|nr:SRPBCC family protein [uncultured Roseobacter sp.]
MKFSTQEDIAMPADAVFDALCDFESFERAAEKRGAVVRRTDALSGPETGMTWQAEFTLRGKPREVSLQLTELRRPEDIVLDISSPGLDGEVTFELSGLTPGKTRLTAGIELRPRTLAARLLVQSLKLTRTSLMEKYQARVAEHVRGMESRFATGQTG